MNEINVNQLLVQMRAMAEKADGLNTNFSQNNIQQTAETSDFSTLLKSSVEKVSDLQKNAGDMAKRFELGDETVDLTDLMINMQKSSLAFQAMTHVRNRLVSAYQDVMNMQI